MRKVLQWIADRLPAREISDNGEPYLRRYYVGTVFGWRVYLHHFVGSDPNRGLHDHPWAKAISIVLAGHYIEETRRGREKIRWLNGLVGDSFHRVIIPEGTSCWTMFCHTAGDVKSWGFLQDRRFDPENLRFGLITEGRQSVEGAIWTPYAYPGGAKNPYWWLDAPKGRDLPR